MSSVLVGPGDIVLRRLAHTGDKFDRAPALLHLANSLSKLYPRASEEKRLLDAMLLAYPK